MSRLLDTAVVAIVLAASVLYAMYSLGPKRLRQWLRGRLADLAARAHLGRLERRLREAASAGCGGCESCASSEEGAAARGGAKEFRVPAASIGKRR
jgi:hypothetical protein